MKNLLSLLIVLSLSACATQLETSHSIDKAATSSSASTEQQKPKIPTVCEAPAHHQFDFWIGDWEVTTPDGQYAGKNSIKPILNGCALYESWTGKSGYRGDSINFYDQTRKQWHQTWIDYAGNPLYGDGGLVDGNMVLSGHGFDAKGNKITNRITWTPNDDGSVRQHWQTSVDGKEWTTVFDGLYKKISIKRMP